MAVGNQQRREAPLTGLYGAQPVKDAPHGHAYDFVNCDALAERLTNDGNDVVSPSGARYKAIYLGGSSRSMTLAALRRIAALADRRCDHRRHEAGRFTQPGRRPRRVCVPGRQAMARQRIDRGRQGPRDRER
jgi:hypothetical protein